MLNVALWEPHRCRVLWEARRCRPSPRRRRRRRGFSPMPSVAAASSPAPAAASPAAAGAPSPHAGATGQAAAKAAQLKAEAAQLKAAKWALTLYPSTVHPLAEGVSPNPKVAPPPPQTLPQMRQEGEGHHGQSGSRKLFSRRSGGKEAKSITRRQGAVRWIARGRSRIPRPHPRPQPRDAGSNSRRPGVYSAADSRSQEPPR